MVDCSRVGECCMSVWGFQIRLGGPGSCDQCFLCLHPLLLPLLFLVTFIKIGLAELASQARKKNDSPEPARRCTAGRSTAQTALQTGSMGTEKDAGIPKRNRLESAPQKGCTRCGAYRPFSRYAVRRAFHSSARLDSPMNALEAKQLESMALKFRVL